MFEYASHVIVLIIDMLSSLAVGLNTELGRLLKLTMGLHYLRIKCCGFIQLTLNLLFIALFGTLHLFTSLEIAVGYRTCPTWRLKYPMSFPFHRS